MKKVLIANRGEIAVRIIRACAEAGYQSVAVYSDQDAEALHVRLADEAHALGGVTAAESYLSIEAVLAAAAQSGADAVHPGYGFLSERADFARAVEQAGLIWIGPDADTIQVLGDKMTARQIARRVGAPLAPGTDTPLSGADEAVAFAAEHGLPIAIKAAHGGGGRGIKVVRDASEVAAAFASATREATAAFGRGECFVERFLDTPRHVEVQIVGDGHGGVVVIGDRDCSLQRRNQKLIEEAPAPGLSDDQRRLLHAAARDLCAEVNYRSAGTVEFLLAADGTLSFLEVNTRLQVEHPITEMVTGVDLVAEQLRIAAGDSLSVTSTPEPVGHAIECRINAEDPGRGFLPSPARIDSLRVPGGPGVRWDGGVEVGDVVQPAFDSLMAKLMVWGTDRDAALARARRALAELELTGPATVVPFHRLVMDEPAFSTAGFSVHTQWIESDLMPRLEPQLRPAASDQPGWIRMPVELDGRRVVLGFDPAVMAAHVPAGTFLSEAGAVPPAQDEQLLTSPVPGSVVRWLVDDGVQVGEGEAVVVLDAMKLETSVVAHRSGVLHHWAAVGDLVAVDDPLAKLESSAQ